MKQLIVEPGQHILSVFEQAFNHFNISKEPVTFKHNGLRVILIKDEVSQ